MPATRNGATGSQVTRRSKTRHTPADGTTPAADEVQEMQDPPSAPKSPVRRARAGGGKGRGAPTVVEEGASQTKETAPNDPASPSKKTRAKGASRQAARNGEAAEMGRGEEDARQAPPEVEGPVGGSPSRKKRSVKDISFPPTEEEGDDREEGGEGGAEGGLPWAESEQRQQKRTKHAAVTREEETIAGLNTGVFPEVMGAEEYQAPFPTREAVLEGTPVE
ncbi:hypothetical protein Naga_101322g1, partial [Nannochloropsis gaditana]